MFWFPSQPFVSDVGKLGLLMHIVNTIFWVPLFVLAIISIAKRRKEKEHHPILLSCLLFALGYSVFFTRVRFRLPIEPVFIIFANMLIIGFIRDKLKLIKSENND